MFRRKTQRPELMWLGGAAKLGCPVGPVQAQQTTPGNRGPHWLHPFHRSAGCRGFQQTEATVTLCPLLVSLLRPRHPGTESRGLRSGFQPFPRVPGGALDRSHLLWASLPLLPFPAGTFFGSILFPSHSLMPGVCPLHRPAGKSCPLLKSPRCLQSRDILLNLPASPPHPSEEEQQIGIVMAPLIVLWVSNAIWPHEDHPSEQSPSPSPCHPSHIRQAAHSSLPPTSTETGPDR